MVELNVNGHRLKLYHSAEEMPIKRYSRFQKYLLIEAGVGSNMDGIGTHFSKLFSFLAQKMSAEALQEGKNLFYNHYLILEETNLPAMAFALLLHSVDGVEVQDITEDALKALVEKLSQIGVTQATVQEWNTEVKKKSILN